MTTPIQSVEWNWLCWKQIKSTCQEWVFERIDPGCCDEEKSLYDLCDIPVCVPNAFLASPTSCANWDCNNQQRWIKFTDIPDLLWLWDIKVWATPSDSSWWALSEKLKLCTSLLSSWVIRLTAQSSWWNQYLELCFDRSKLNIPDKLVDLDDWPGNLGTCSNIVINGSNFNAKPVLVWSWSTWSRQCARRKDIAHIYINGIPPIVDVAAYTFSYPLTQHYDYMEYASWNVSAMNTTLPWYGKCITINNSWFYEIESKLAYHIDEYINAVKHEVIKISGGTTTILSDKDGSFACNKDIIDAPPTDNIVWTWTKNWRFDLSPVINAHKIVWTVWLQAWDILTFRPRVDTNFCDITYAVGHTWSILVWPSSVYTTDVALNGSYLTVKEREPITYIQR